MIDAAEVLKRSKKEFEGNVIKSMKGGYIGSEKYDNVSKWINLL